MASHGQGNGHEAGVGRAVVLVAVAFIFYGAGWATRTDPTIKQVEPPHAGPNYSEALPAKGPVNAKVVFVEVADLKCQYCAKRHSLVKRAMAEHRDVRFVFKHFPFLSEYSTRGAHAAMAAHRQGRFYEYVEQLYLNQKDAWTDERLTQLALKLSLPGNEFAEAMNGPSIRSYVRYDAKAARRLGIEATPAFFINGIPVPSEANADTIRRIIRKAKRQVDDLMKEDLTLEEARLEATAQNALTHKTQKGQLIQRTDFADLYLNNDATLLGDNQ